MHSKRIITAAFGLPILFVIIEYGGNFIFAGFIALAVMAAFYEYEKIVFKGFDYKKFMPIRAASYIFAAASIYGMYIEDKDFLLFVTVFNLFLSAFISMFEYHRNPDICDAVIKRIFGYIYIPLFLSFTILIKNSDNGSAWIYLLLASVFAGDSGAFYVGTYLGRHKLIPAVSPNKTVEGSIAGLLSSIAAGFFIRHFFLADISWQKCLVICIVIAVAGQIGDLFESMLKRSSGVKDSGSILPGHGGILDRIDALLFAAPFAYFVKEFF